MVKTHSKIGTIAIEVDNQMVVIQIQVGKNIIENVLLDGGASVNIITENLRKKLGLLKPKPTPYHLRMADQTISNETISLLNIEVSKIRISEKSELEQGTSYQRTTKVVPSITKLEDFHVKPKISLEDKVYPKTYYHHSQTMLKWMKHQPKHKYKIFR